MTGQCPAPLAAAGSLVMWFVCENKQGCRAFAPPQTPPGKHSDPRSVCAVRIAFPRIRRGSGGVESHFSPESRTSPKRQKRRAKRLFSDCRPPGELERVATLSNFQSRPAACTVGTGRYLRRKISFSREKIVSLQAPRPKNLRFLAETGEGGSGGGACFPVHQLVKTFFDKLSDSLKGIAFGGRLRPPGGTSRRMALPSLRVGSADRSFPGLPGKPENSGTSIYGFRIRR